MKKYICLTICFFCVYAIAHSQLIGMNKKSLEENRYEDIKGSPFLFKGWVLASVIDKKGQEITNVLVNYNGYTNGFEAKIEQGYIEMSPTDYPKIILNQGNSYFQYAAHPKMKDQYIQVLFDDPKQQLIKTFVVTISTRKLENVGKTIILESFVPKKTYYLSKEGNLQLIKLKKKEILKLFPQKEVANFIKEKQLKLNSEESIVEILDFISKNDLDGK